MLPAFDPWLEAGAALEVARAGQCDHMALSRMQKERLLNLLVAARERSPLYSRLLGGLDLETVQLAQLPVMCKAALMAQFDDWVADPALRLADLSAFIADSQRIAQPYLGRYLVWESSGSSGVPGIFVQDPRAMAVNDALEAWRRPALHPLRRLLDPTYLGEVFAFVGAIDGHFASTVSVQRLRVLNPALAPNLHSVSFLQPFDTLLATLERLAPTILATYPSVALLLAEAQDRGQLRIRPLEVWTGGETLSSAERQKIEAVFDCPLSNSYGASEFLSLASQCRAGHLHLNSDWALLESIDEQGCAVPDGQTGTTCLLTNLANHVQPLIRYELGDRIRFAADPCPCGSALPVIEVYGRSDDILRMRDPAGHQRSLLPLALTTVLEEDAGMNNFQLIQQGPASLQLRTPVRGAVARAQLVRGRKALRSFLLSQGLAEVNIRCSSGLAHQIGRSGKLQRVIATHN